VRDRTALQYLTNRVQGYMFARHMRIDLRRFAIVLSLWTAACGDATGTSGVVTLCPQATWAAIQREGQPWEAIPVTRARYPLGAGERIGLARIRGTAEAPDSLQIYYVTTEQAGATFSCDTPPTGVSWSKELHGTVRGIGTLDTDSLAPSGRAAITVGIRSATVGETQDDFTVSNIQSGTSDLVAAAFNVGRSTIVRRGVDYPDGSTIPVLDFGSSEAFGLQANTVSVTGNTNNYISWQATNEIITKKGTLGMLNVQYLARPATTSAIYSVPADKLLDGDLNSLTVALGLSRVTVYYRIPSDRVLEAGPLANLPTITTAGTGSDLDTRIDEESQPEYGSQITLYFYPPSGVTRPVIIASKEYFGGTPVSWSFTLPDFRGVGDFPFNFDSVWSSASMGLEVTDRPYLALPSDGVTYRSGMR
jgi:hypothetical protein